MDEQTSQKHRILRNVAHLFYCVYLSFTEYLDSFSIHYSYFLLFFLDFLQFQILFFKTFLFLLFLSSCFRFANNIKISYHFVVFKRFIRVVRSNRRRRRRRRAFVSWMMIKCGKMLFKKDIFI